VIGVAGVRPATSTVTTFYPIGATMTAQDSQQAAIDRLNMLRSIADLHYAPDGRSLVATISPVSREGADAPRPHVWRFDLDGTPTQLTHGAGEHSPRYSPDGQVLAFLADRETQGKADIYLIGPGQEARLAGEVEGSVEDYRFTPDGTRIVAQTADRGVNGGATTGAARLWWGDPQVPEVTTPTSARRRLVSIELVTGLVTEVGPLEENVWEFDLIGANAAAAIVSMDASERGWHHARLVRVDLTTREITTLHTPHWQIQGLCAEPGGPRVAFTEGWSSDRGLVVGEIGVVDARGGPLVPVARAELSSVTDLHWRDSNTLVFAGWERLGSVWGVLRLDGAIEHREVEQAVVGDSAFVARLTPSPDGQSLAAIRDSVGAPAEIFVRADSTSPWRQITKLNGDVAANFPDYPKIRTISWRGRDGLVLEGVVMLPRERTPGPLPAIVDIHGGPCYTAKPQFNPTGAIPLVAAGYAVFLPNYRGNVGWGQAFSRLDVGDPAGEEFEDILAGIDYCVAQGWIDPERLGVTGGSYGGYLTAWAVATTHRFKAAIMVSGIVNQVSCHYSCEHHFHELINGGPLTEPKNLALAIDRSPLFKLDKPTTPTMMVHGADDRCTPVGQAQEFYAALIERGVHSELVIYPGEGHGIRKPGHRKDFARRRLEWFDRYLRPQSVDQA
jgi:dipeptidyl aminopeptidase/acylaminoacyl peptidase